MAPSSKRCATGNIKKEKSEEEPSNHFTLNLGSGFVFGSAPAASSSNSEEKQTEEKTSTTGSSGGFLFGTPGQNNFSFSIGDDKANPFSASNAPSTALSPSKPTTPSKPAISTHKFVDETPKAKYYKDDEDNDDEEDDEDNDDDYEDVEDEEDDEDLFKQMKGLNFNENIQEALFNQMMMQLGGYYGTEEFFEDDDEGYVDEEDDDEGYEDDDDFDIGDEMDRAFISHLLGTAAMQSGSTVSPARKSKVSSSGVQIEEILEDELDLVTGGAQKIIDKKVSIPKDSDHGTITPTELQETLNKLSYMLSTDLAISNNSLFYEIFQSAMKRFYMEVKRMTILELCRQESGQMDLQAEEVPPDVMAKLCYEVQPSTEFLANIVNNEFVPRSKQKQIEDILKDNEMKRLAKVVIKSKNDRKSTFEMNTEEKYTEKYDRNSFSFTGDDGDEFDEDPNDPEYRHLSPEDDSDELDKLKRFKTMGAFLKRIQIGNFSPSMNYEGQHRIKVNPITKKLYYKFFTFVPRYNPEDEETHQIVERAVRTNEKSSRKFNAFYNEVFRDFDRFKISHLLSMEVPYESIVGIHIQQVRVDKNIQDIPLALLVLELNKKPTFISRRIACVASNLNEEKERLDFTKGRQASRFKRHYIIGDDRELRRIVAVMLESDETGRLSQLYSEGMDNIAFEQTPSWEYSVETEKPIVSKSKRAEKIVRPITREMFEVLKEEDLAREKTEEDDEEDGEDGYIIFSDDECFLDAIRNMSPESMHKILKSNLQASNYGFDLDDDMIVADFISGQEEIQEELGDDLYYSFCYGHLCTKDHDSHCNSCGKCVDWHFWHCDNCNQCTYGQSIPRCEHCGSGGIISASDSIVACPHNYGYGENEFIDSEDEKEEAAKSYNSDTDEFDFVNHHTMHQYTQ